MLSGGQQPIGSLRRGPSDEPTAWFHGMVAVYSLDPSSCNRVCSFSHDAPNVVLEGAERFFSQAREITAPTALDL